MQNLIKAFYTVADLASLLRLSPKATRAFLKRLNIPRVPGNGKHIYLLADIRTAAPELYNSITEASSLNSILELEDTEAEAFAAQFISFSRS